MRSHLMSVGVEMRGVGLGWLLFSVALLSVRVILYWLYLFMITFS